MEKLAKALREEMARRNHSATRAAAEMGVSPPTVINWSKGWVSKTPDPEHWPIIANYLGVPPFVILEWFDQLTSAQVELLRTIPGYMSFAEGLALSGVERAGYLNLRLFEPLTAAV